MAINFSYHRYLCSDIFVISYHLYVFPIYYKFLHVFVLWWNLHPHIDFWNHSFCFTYQSHALVIAFLLLFSLYMFYMYILLYLCNEVGFMWFHFIFSTIFLNLAKSYLMPFGIPPQNKLKDWAVYSLIFLTGILMFSQELNFLLNECIIFGLMFMNVQLWLRCLFMSILGSENFLDKLNQPWVQKSSWFLQWPKGSLGHAHQFRWSFRFKDLFIAYYFGNDA